MDKKRKLLFIGVIICLFAWVISGIYSYYSFYDGQYEDIIIADSILKMIYLRILFTIIVYVFGVILSNEYGKRKQSETELETEKIFLQTIFDNSSIGICVVDKKGSFIKTNNFFCDLTEYSEDEMKQINLFDIIYKEDVKETKDAFTKVITEAEKNISIEERSITKYGKIIYISEKFSLIKIDKKNKLILVVFEDITNRKKMEIKLEESEYKYRSIVENIDNAVIIIQHYKLIYWNKIFLSLTKYTKNEIKKMKIYDFIYKEDINRFKKYLELLEKDKAPPNIFNLKLKTKSNKLRNIEIHTTEIISNDMRQFILVLWDRTELIKKEKIRLEHYKLKDIATLVAGIAHDFNNFLTSIALNIHLAIDELEKNPKGSIAHLKKAYKVTGNAGKLTQHLLTFAKGGEPILKSLDTVDLFKTNVKFFLAGSKIKVKFHFSKDTGNVFGDGAQLEQVIQNLAVDSKEAIGKTKNGTITITVGNENLPEANIYFLKEGNYVKIIYKDTGPGIKKENLSKVFSPYFTTKKTGTGLGLSIVYSIIQKHNGYIGIESEYGKGVMFTIYLPATVKISKPKRKTTAISAKDLTGTSILLMDDEKFIRDSGKLILENFGFNVKTVKKGEEAIEKYKNALDKGKPFKLVILDMTIIDGMGGKETFHKLREIDSEVKIILMSGYSKEQLPENLKDNGYYEFVKKPFDVNEFIQKVKTVLQ